MTRRLLLCALVLPLVSWVAALSVTPTLAADPAQRVVRVGFVGPESPSTAPRGVSAFWERLSELGWIRGQNLIVEERWAEGRIDRLPALMAEVVGRKVDVIVTWSTPGAVAAKNATSTIPIVVATMGDPVGAGVAASLARPGGNLTGLSLEWSEGIPGKWLELLREAVLDLSTVAVLSNPNSQHVRALSKRLDAEAPVHGVKLRFIDVQQADALEPAFEQARRAARAIIVLPDPLTMQNRRRIAALAARHRLPAMYGLLEFVDAGGLMAYGTDHAVLLRHAADYVDKLLRGARAAELPIEQPTQFVLAINLKAAKALRLTFPESILLRADEVIR